MNPDIRTSFAQETFTASHVVTDLAGVSCAIVDSVLDFGPYAGRTSCSGQSARCCPFHQERVRFPVAMTRPRGRDMFLR